MRAVLSVDGMRVMRAMWALVVCTACSSSSASTTGEPGPSAADAGTEATAPPQGGGGGLQCSGACCPLPQVGASCTSADEGQTCSTSMTCSGGLLLPAPVTCTNGTWTTQAACDTDAGVASNGCPDSQPTNGAPCTLPNGTWCQYALVCPGTCDAGTTAAGDGSAGSACVGVAGKVGPAFCKGGAWQTTPLGSCP